MYTYVSIRITEVSRYVILKVIRSVMAGNIATNIIFWLS